jgi:hypothetical protein
MKRDTLMQDLPTESDLADGPSRSIGFLIGCLLLSSWFWGVAYPRTAANDSQAQVTGGTEQMQAQAKSGADSAQVSKLAALKAGNDRRNWRNRESLYYKRNWGVEIIGVKPVSSGYMLEFSYRVLDPDKVKLLNDRKSKAYLRDEASGTVLAVPAMENVGELRSGSAPELDRIYFMIFGNPGKLVKSGSRVSIIVGDFHVDGVIVD